MDSIGCYLKTDGAMPAGTYAVSIKVSDYIRGNPTPMSIVPAKFILKILPDNGCNSRYFKKF